MHQLAEEKPGRRIFFLVSLFFFYGFLWVFYGFPWVFYGFSKFFLWFSMGFLWFSMGFPCCFFYSFSTVSFFDGFLWWFPKVFVEASFRTQDLTNYFTDLLLIKHRFCLFVGRSFMDFLCDRD